MIPVKNAQEIKLMKQSGRILAQVFSQVLEEVKPGVKLIDLEKKANQLILQNNAKPSFKMVDNYRYATCLNINEGIVHGIPGKYRIKAGDIVTLDMGVCFKGWNTDMARTFLVAAKELSFTPEVEGTRPVRRGRGDTSGVDIGGQEVARFLKVGRIALKKAIAQARAGNHVGHISQAIQQTVEKAGYNVVRILTGHGIGRRLHEPPVIRCFLKGKIVNTPKLKDGMTLAIEVIYTQGKPDLIHSPKDRWTLKTADGKLSGLFENTVLIAKKSTLVLTQLKTLS